MSAVPSEINYRRDRQTDGWTGFQLYIYPLKNSQAVKKAAALCKMASMKKVVKYRWRPRNGCDGRSVTKISITTIQVNLCYVIPASLGIGTKFT